MTTTVIPRLIQTIERAACLTEGSVRPGDTLADIGCDSLTGIHILSALEDEFQIGLPDELIDTTLSIDDLARKVQDALNL